MSDPGTKMTDNVTNLETLVAQEQALEAQEAAIQVQEQSVEAQEAALLKTMETPPPAPPAPAPVPVPAPPAPTPPAPAPVPVPPAPAPTGPISAIPAIIDGPFMMSVIGVNVGAIYASTAVASMPLFDPTTKSGGNLIPAMGTTGAHPEIGFITGDAMMALGSNMDAHAVASVRSTADCSVNWPIHVTDKTTGEMPAKPWLNARESFNGDTSNLINDAQTNPNALAPDVAHQPHFIYLTAMHCLLKKDPGFSKYLKELKAWVSWNFFTGPTQTRGPTGVEGIINPEASAYQPRGEGWGPAALYQLFHVMNVANTYGLPFEDDGWYAWCKQAVENNIHYLEHKYHLGDYDESYAVPYYNVPTGWAKNDFGLLQFPMDVMSNGAIGYGKGADGKTVVVGAFMQAFQSWVVMWLAKMGPKMDLSATAKSELASLAAWAGKWPVMMFGDSTDPNAWPWQYAGMYTINIGAWNADGSVTYAKNGGAMFALNGQPRPTGTAFLNHDTTNVADQFLDYYVANIWPALVYANDFGVAGSNASVARAVASDQWKAGPVFAPAFSVMTRGKKFPVANTPPVTTPPVTTPPSPPPAAPAPTTPTTTPPAAPAPAPTTPIPPTPAGSLPLYVGPPLTYFGIPQTNTPKDAVPAMYVGLSDETRPFDIWGGMAYFKLLRKFVLRADGHENTNFQCTMQSQFAADYSSVTWSCGNAPDQAYLETDAVAGRMPNGSYAAGHPYLGLHALSEAFGGPALLSAFYAGSTDPNFILKLDIQAASGGYDFFAGVTPDAPIVFEQWANGPSFSGGTYPIACMWEVAEGGMFVAQEGAATDGDILVQWNGTRVKHPTLTGNYRNGFHLVDVTNQHRIGFSGGKTSVGAAFSVVIEELTGPNAGIVHTVPITGDTIGLPDGDGDGGTWYQPDRCAIDHAVRYDRFVGYFEDSADGVPKFMEFTPGANRLTDPWTLKLQPLALMQGDTIAPAVPPKSLNSLWNKGKWVDGIDSYVIAPTATGLVGIRPSFATGLPAA